MTFRKVFQEFADLFLKADPASADWLNVKKLRVLWYLLVILLIFGVLIHIIAALFSLQEFVPHNETALLIWRSLWLFLYLSMLLTLILMTSTYFKYIVENKSKIYFENILFFYVLSIFLFSFVYLQLYLLDSNSFIYSNSLNTKLPVAGSSVIKARVDFLLFSAFQNLNGNYTKIRMNSVIANILGWIQSLYVLALIALFIASYVNQKTCPGKEKNDCQ